MSIKVYRTSTKRLPHPTIGEEMTPAHVGIEEFSDAYKTVRIAFKTPQSSFALFIEAESFSEIAKAMLASDANAAIKAFGSAMTEGIMPPDQFAANRPLRSS